MSGFSSSWLALRAAADDRARSRRLIERLTATLPEPPLSIADLGAGSGATMAALSPLLPKPLNWQLVDHDEALLAEAVARAQKLGVGARAVPLDLAAGDFAFPERRHAVTASALFDLTSSAFIEAFADVCAAQRLPVLAMLTFDGILSAEPIDPEDTGMREAFNRHQRGMKSFGEALGPDAPAALAEAFAARGYSVDEDASPWLLRAGRDDALISATLEGWAEAAREIAAADGREAAKVDDWLQRRLERTDRLVVGHRDQLFLPA